MSLCIFPTVKLKTSIGALSPLINTTEGHSYQDKRLINANFELVLTLPFFPLIAYC